MILQCVRGEVIVLHSIIVSVLRVMEEGTVVWLNALESMQPNQMFALVEEDVFHWILASVIKGILEDDVK
ncbi:hypothetical protein D3C80_1894410 [compost metagenome]